MGSLWGQAVPPSVSYGTGVDGYAFGVVFTLAAAAPLTGIRYYSAPEETVLPSKCGIFDVATKTIVPGTENDSPAWSGAAGSGWVTCSYDGSATLDTRTAGYCALILWPSGGKSYRTVTYPVTGGGLAAPAADVYGSANAPFAFAWQYPDKSGAAPGGGGYDWGIDVVLADPALPEFSASLQSADPAGVQTWSAVSEYNGPDASVLRVLPPSAPDADYPHSFLIALPVSTGTDDAYGDPLAVLGGDLGAHNAYNATVVVPSFPIQPWYADNPDNTQQAQESFILNLASWLTSSEFASGGEKIRLIGFSKSGIGGQGLIFRHPDVFAACASWDAPFMMTGYDGTDPVYGTVGGDPADCYGTAANFTANYELSTANIARWTAAQDFTSTRRLWIGGYYVFEGDVQAYGQQLAGLGILAGASWDTQDTSHAWHDDWVSAALESLFAAGGGTPPPAPEPVLFRAGEARTLWRTTAARNTGGA